jgi:hypothetical protein
MPKEIKGKKAKKVTKRKWTSNGMHLLELLQDQLQDVVGRQFELLAVAVLEEERKATA